MALLLGMLLWLVVSLVGLALMRGASRASRMEERDRVAAELELAARANSPLAHEGATESPVLDRAEKRLAPWYDETNFFI